MKTSLSRVGCVVVGAVCGLTLGLVSADDVAVKSGKKSNREKLHEERPDDSRGWVVVAKESFWPLCYESLDRIEEAIEQIGSDDREALADTLDKCGAWLSLAASAAMSDGESGVVGASDRLIYAAELIRKGDSELTNDHLHQIATLGLLSMAKSHLIRAGEPAVSSKHEVEPRKSKSLSSVIAEAEKDAGAERMERRHAQRRHDTIESRKHLVVAQTYLNAAADEDGFAVDPALTSKIPAVPADFELVTYNDELGITINAMLKCVDSHRKVLIKGLDGKF